MSRPPHAMARVSASEGSTTRLSPRPGDIEITAEQLRRTPLMAGAPRTVDRRLKSLMGQGSTIVRHYQPGEIIVRQGEPGWTAFYLVREADARSLDLPPLHSRDDRSEPPGVIDATSATRAGFLLRGASGLPRKAEVFIGAETKPSPSVPRSPWTRLGDLFFRRLHDRPIASAAPRPTAKDDDLGSRVAYLREGELFGEVSCFHHAPRNATVRATDDCYVIEMVRNVLEIALDNPRFKETLDELYRKRVLHSALAEIPLFHDAPYEALTELRRHAQMRSYPLGERVFDEGEPADAIYMVRMGSVRVSQGGREGEVLSYASRGESMGTDAVLAGTAYTTRCEVFSPGGHASNAARSTKRLGAQMVRIPKTIVDAVIDAHPSIAATASQLRTQAASSAREVSTRRRAENLAGTLGLLQADEIMLIDLDTCTRCNDCVRACASTHGGVSRLERQGPRFGSFLIPDTCRQCHEPTCMIGCPVGSIHRGPGGEIVIEDWCIGCGLCVEQCPYDAIRLDPRGGRSSKAVTCDQCASVGDGTPMCVYACGTGAARRVDGRAFFGKTTEQEQER